MTDERENPPFDQAVLPQAHRTIRLLDPGEGPLEGALVGSPDGPVVRRDAEGLTGWAGWRYAGSQHVAAPLDVVRRARGHDVLLPWCTETLHVFLERAGRARGGLSSGEISTVVVSMLRGLSELGPMPAAEVPGAWWLTERGRPVFVLGAGQDAASAVLAVLDRLHADCADKALIRVLDRLREHLRTAAAQRRVPRRLLEEGERELLEIAAPRPLESATEDQTGASVGAATALRRLRADSATRSRLRETGVPRDRPRVRERATVAAALRAFLDHLSSRARALVRPREVAAHRGTEQRSTRPRRARIFVVAGVCAAAVLVAGSLWPSGGEGSAAGSPDAGTATTARPWTSDPADETSWEPARSPMPSPTAGVTPPVVDDPLAALPDVITRIAECESREDPVCATAIAGGAPAIRAVAAELIGGEDPVLVDRYGDIAVLELSSSSAGREGSGAGAMIVVLVWVDEKWLVRDAYRVADQPR